MRFGGFLLISAFTCLTGLAAAGAPATVPVSPPTTTTVEVHAVESSAYSQDPQTPRDQVVLLAPPSEMINWLQSRLGANPFAHATIEAAPRDDEVLITRNGVTASHLAIGGNLLEDWSLELLQAENGRPTSQQFNVAGEVRVRAGRRMFLFPYRAKIRALKVRDLRGFDMWQATNATITWESPQEWKSAQ